MVVGLRQSGEEAATGPLNMSRADTVRAKLARFARKPPPDQWAAIKANLAAVPALRRRSDNALRRAKAERMAFHSGLGDSANLLYGLVRSMKPETCVEIGSARGKSACYIGMALKENGGGQLYAIDPHMPSNWNDPGSVDSIELFRANIAALGLAEQITIIRALSEEAARHWDRAIDLMFIDGDHSYDGVKRDWELFLPYVKPFGVVVFHDTIWDLTTPDLGGRPDLGVPRFVDELRRQGYQALTIDRDCGLTLIQPTLGGIPLLSTPVGAVGQSSVTR